MVAVVIVSPILVCICLVRLRGEPGLSARAQHIAYRGLLPNIGLESIGLTPAGNASFGLD